VVGRYNTSVAYWKTNLKHLQTAIEYHLFCGEKQALIVRPAKKRKSSAPASTVTKQVVIEKTDFDPTLVGSPRHDFDAGPSDEEQTAEQTVPCTPPSNSTTPASSPILAMTPVARRRIFGTQSIGSPSASPAPTVYSLYIDIYIYYICSIYDLFDDSQPTSGQDFNFKSYEAGQEAVLATSGAPAPAPTVYSVMLTPLP
jgi:hypothetical protein